MKKPLLQRGLATALLLAVLLGLLPGAGVMTAFAEDSETRESTVIDFSAPGTETQAVPVGQIANDLVDGGISNIERDFLNDHSSYTVYISSVPTDAYRAYVYEGGVRVLADAYAYETADGQAVTWVPSVVITASGEPYFLTWSDRDAAYMVDIPGAVGDQAEIYYAAILTFTEVQALGMVNESYLAAVQLESSLLAYEAAYGAWNEQYQLYEDYVTALDEWQKQVDAYDAYVEAQQAYDRYDANLNAWAAYNQWAKYQEDLAAYEAYKALASANAEEWAAYEQNVIAYRRQLAALDRMYVVSTYSERSFFSMMTGGAANYVMNNQNVVSNIAGVNENDVKGAARATAKLQTLLKEYDVLRLSGNVESCYAFYAANYETISTELTRLYDCMGRLGRVPGVVEEIRNNGGYDLLLMMLANLYVHNAQLKDDETMDASTVILGDRAVSDLVEETLRPTDENNATPLSAEMPAPPASPDGIEPVPYPGDPPAEASRPTEPEPDPDGERPVQPDPVILPGEAPAEVTNPGEAPDEPVLSAAEQALYDGRESLSVRTVDQLSVGLSVQADQVCTVTVKNAPRLQVVFLDRSGNTYSTKYVTFGQAVNQPAPPHVSASSGLTFVGWSTTPDGEPISLDYISRTLVLYPIYEVAETEPESSETEPTPTETTENGGGCGSSVHGGGWMIVGLILLAAAWLVTRKRRQCL